jgi:aspartyl-tRNA(Asn)/glutamyl-tRNA(Gln) amidotransferase subunit C
MSARTAVRKLPRNSVRIVRRLRGALITDTVQVLMAVSRDDVQHVAQLARLDFSEEEERQMAEELSQILDYVDKLNELDTSGVRPMSHVLDVTNVFRADEVETRINREQALEPAPEDDDEHFQVPKVIE